MITTRHHRIYDDARLLACPDCGAGAGEPCAPPKKGTSKRPCQLRIDLRRLLMRFPEALKRACPKCGAPPGTLCWRKPKPGIRGRTLAGWLHGPRQVKEDTERMVAPRKKKGGKMAFEVNEIIDDLHRMQQKFAGPLQLSLEIGALVQATRTCANWHKLENFEELERSLGIALLTIHKICRIQGWDPELLLDDALYRAHGRFALIEEGVEKGKTYEELEKEAEERFP